MAISTELWRARIGSFRTVAASAAICVLICCTLYRLLCVISYLPLIGCVELSPRSLKANVPAMEKHIDNLAVEVRATHTKAQLELKALSD